jgi:hypothetical protein
LEQLRFTKRHPESDLFLLLIPLVLTYEFVSDQYATVQWDHFSGRVFAVIPFMRKTNWRENDRSKSCLWIISDANRATMLQD